MAPELANQNPPDFWSKHGQMTLELPVKTVGGSGPQEKVNLKDLVDLCEVASEKILEVYHSSDWETETKSDYSPLTKADRVSNEIICSTLQSMYPTIPIISEENEAAPYKHRKDYNYHFSIDPIDGTKEFIQRNGEFTVNIGLCQGETPIAGVVMQPTTGSVYFGAKGLGAYVLENKVIRPIRCLEFSENDSDLKVVASKSHVNEATTNFMKKFKNHTVVSLGSSLKFMLIADGRAHVYPRIAPTCEWDVCASHAILNECGGQILKATVVDGAIQLGSEELKYNKENLLNPFFVAYAKRTSRE